MRVRSPIDLNEPVIIFKNLLATKLATMSELPEKLCEKYHLNPDDFGLQSVNSETQNSLKTFELEKTEDSSRGNNLESSTDLVLEVNKVTHEEDSDTSEPDNGDAINSERGGYDYKLKNEQLPEGIEECSVCHLIPRSPAKVSCCGNIFCHFCVKTYSSCPLCMQEFTWMIDKLHERKIHELEVWCVNHTDGCEWTGELRQMEEHLNWNPQESDQESRKCLYQVTSCKKCDKKMTYKIINDHLKNECVHRTVNCNFVFAGCDFQGPELRMSKHLQDSMSEHLILVTRIVKQDNTKLHSSKHTEWLKYFLVSALLAVVISCIVTTLITLPMKEEISSTNKGLSDILEDPELEWKITITANQLGIENLEDHVNKDINDRLFEQEQRSEQLTTKLRELEKKLTAFMSQSSFLGKIKAVLVSMLRKVLPIYIDLSLLEQ